MGLAALGRDAFPVLNSWVGIVPRQVASGGEGRGRGRRMTISPEGGPWRGRSTAVRAGGQGADQGGVRAAGYIELWSGFHFINMMMRQLAQL